MAAELNRSIGELFRIVMVMEKRGYLQKSSDTDRYTVAYKILDLAYRATPAQDLTRAAASQMEALALAVEQSCHLVVPNGGTGLVVARQENPIVRGFALRLGAPVDLIKSCSGCVLLAFSPPDRVERILELAPTGRAAVDTVKLEKRLEKVRRQGFEMMASAITRGVTDMSYPVFGFHGDADGGTHYPVSRADRWLAESRNGRGAPAASGECAANFDLARPSRGRMRDETVSSSLRGCGRIIGADRSPSMCPEVTAATSLDPARGTRP